MSQKRPAPSASPGPAKPKRVRKDKSKSQKKSLVRILKIDKQLYDALKAKQHDLIGDDTCHFGGLSLKGDQVFLTDSFLAESGGVEKGLYKSYLMEKVQRSALRPSQARSSSNSGGAAAEKKKKGSSSRRSCEIPLKVFTKDATDRRILVEDIGDQYNIKAPPGARRFVTKQVVKTRTISIDDTVMQDGPRTDKSVSTTVSTRDETKPGDEVLVSDAQIQGAIYKLFRLKPAWTKKRAG
eukprot:INCI9375.1.p1 GENE.INCI9375.1~~INCI9375.1.p1  ORF type:complete len:239 (-),score=42.32 INCI9375.1:175-891(-)